jgi:ribonuclease HII
MAIKFDPACLPPTPQINFEQALWAQGIIWVGGIDEAGRGAWAGPVAAAVVVLPNDAGIAQILTGVRDSKQMMPAQRTYWAQVIKNAAQAWAVGFAACQEIDSLGILPATRLAAQRSLLLLSKSPDHLLLDYITLPAVRISQTPLVKGDARSLTIACASVLAKTARDACLVEMDALYPGYGFSAHKGYGTARHRAALQRLGPCPEHRLSFSPLKATPF